MLQTSPVWSVGRRRSHALPHMFALCALLLAVVLAPAAPARARADDLAPFLGRYHPNTTIELRGDQLWFVRPPYESQLVSIGGGLFGFTQGYLQGTPLHFAHNDDGSSSILLLSGAGTWYEFARSGTPYPIDPALATAFEQVLDQSVADMGIPGVMMAVSVPGQGMWAGARGMSDRNVGVPMVPTDHFRIASVSKMFVATVALQLVQEGWLLLDQNVEQWLPGLLPNGDQVSVRQLLNHTSGVYDYLSDGFALRAVDDPGRFWSPEELVAIAAQHGPVFAPGARWSYSNTNYVLLGLIIERVTHYPLHQEIRNRILSPLGLYNTFFEPFEVPPSVIRSYQRQRDLTTANLSFAWGAGSMTSTTEDLARFAQALFGGALLRPETLDLMQSYSAASGSLSYGLGLMQDRISPGVRADGQPRAAVLGLVRGHTGELIGERTVLWYLPERGITLAVTINLASADPNRVAQRALQVVLGYLGD